MPTQSFSYTAGWQKWVVPTGVRIVDVAMRGGGSGPNTAGRITGKLRCLPGDVLWIFVGEQGDTNSGRENGGQSRGGGGRGGRGGAGRLGGDGGGGATALYLLRDATKADKGDRGSIQAIAGGAGGNAGDGNRGGQGGSTVGASGGASVDGVSVTPYSAMGGTQNQGGKGGNSQAGSNYAGGDAPKDRFGRGGAGGQAPAQNTHGGGGGGGGWYPGGGGAAAAIGKRPGGGGAGGSNYVGGLFSASSFRGTGGTGHGAAEIEWVVPGSSPPTTPTEVRVNGNAEGDAMATRAVGSVVVSAKVDDPDSDQDIRMVVHVSSNPAFPNYARFVGTWDEPEKRDRVTVNNLQPNTRYYLRLYTKDRHGKTSTTYNSVNFWTNRPPNPPALTLPGDNTEITALVNVTFQWVHSDPDGSGDTQSAFEIVYRTAGDAVTPPGPYTRIVQVSNVSSWVVGAGAFKGRQNYEWMIRTRDQQGAWGTYSAPRSFYVDADVQPPIPVQPANSRAVIQSSDVQFSWNFFNTTGIAQERADLRFRVWGTTDWTVLTGTTLAPGPFRAWTISGSTFEVGFRYEWQVRTWAAGDVSDWSKSADFWTVPAPGSASGPEMFPSGKPQSPLGVGKVKVSIYERGGRRHLGDIKGAEMVRWARKRDDISGATVIVKRWTDEQRKFYSSLRTWRHEMVIWRDNGDGWKRVWEGPLTRIASNKFFLEIEAKDVMAYVYRRILRQGYNDTYQVINGLQVGLSTVVERATQITMNAMAYDDPNILAYLTPLTDPADARNSRTVKDFTKMAWEEIDDLAAHAGLDYTTAGRRIMYWDTHKAIGRLPEMRDGDFSEPPVVTEYGMNAANVFGVTSVSGVYGVATSGLDSSGRPGPEGFLEQLASAYGENDVSGTTAELSRARQEEMKKSLTAQAKRNISGRFPTPLIVRVPDNANLSPDLDIDVNQLIPGVWIPLRSSGGIREVAQWQKLDSMEVNVTSDGEKIGVVMSPAPNNGEDPDADEAATEEA